MCNVLIAHSLPDQIPNTMLKNIINTFIRNSWQFTNNYAGREKSLLCNEELIVCLKNIAIFYISTILSKCNINNENIKNVICSYIDVDKVINEYKRVNSCSYLSRYCIDNAFKFKMNDLVGPLKNEQFLQDMKRFAGLFSKVGTWTSGEIRNVMEDDLAYFKNELKRLEKINCDPIKGTYNAYKKIMKYRDSKYEINDLINFNDTLQKINCKSVKQACYEYKTDMKKKS